MERMPSIPVGRTHTGCRVMVIGLDGMTLKVLLPLAAAGKLPTFARLLQDGAHGVLRSVTNMATGPTWASFATGCRPAKHGILHDFHHHQDSYALRPTSGVDCRRAAFWEVASRAGKTVIVLNVPHTYPAEPVNGVLLAGIDAPSERVPGFAHPPDIYRKLRKTAGDYIIDCGLVSFVENGRVAEGAAAVERETEGRTRAAEHFMSDLNWDLLVVVYSLPDVWQHYYWHTLGETGESTGRDLIHGGYELMDCHLARLLEHLPADGLVVLCSDHGFGPLTGTRDHLNHWLATQGFLSYRETDQQRFVTGLASAFLYQIRQRVDFRRRQQIMASIPIVRRAVETQLRMGGINWESTQAYAALDHQELWLNLEGRQRLGCVAGGQAEPLAQQLKTALLDWRDGTTGQKHINAVHLWPYTQGRGHGHLAPDLLLEWNTSAAQQGLHPLLSGDHDPEGALIVAGPGICPGPLQSNSLIDVAPLALRGLGIAVPESMDGRVPHGLFAGRG